MNMTPAPVKSEIPAEKSRPRSPRPRLEPAAGPPIFAYLRLHWMAILFCGLFLGAAAAYGAWNLLPAKYESYALLQVASTPSAIAPANDPNRGRTDFITYLKTTAQLIKSEFVLNAALNDSKYKIADVPTIKEQKDPIKYLDEKLLVNFSEGSEVIRITLEGDRPDDIRKIVDAVKDAYNREVVEKEIQQKSTLKLKVQEAKTALEEVMKNKTGSDIPVTPRLLPDGLAPRALQPAGGIAAVPPAESDSVKRAKFPMLIQRIAQYETELMQYPAVVKERRSEVESLKKRIEALRTGVPSPDVLIAAEKDLDVVHKREEARRLRRDYHSLNAVSNNPNAESVLRAKERADIADAEAERLQKEKALALEGGRRQDEANRLYSALDIAERNLQSSEERERVTGQMLANAKKELSETPGDIKRVEERVPVIDPQKTDLVTHDEMYHRLTLQLIGLDLELKSPPRVWVRQAASTPTQKDSKKQILGTVAAGFSGFFLIGAFVVLLESRARKLCSLTEMSSACTLPVVGVVPWSPGIDLTRDPVRRADIAEAIDKLRGRVVHGWTSRGATMITVTSPLGDEGKALTAFGLASSLTESGRRTLLVDFDLRSPSLHEFAGVPNQAGVCEMLLGEVDASEVAVELPSGMTFVSAGAWSDEVRRAASGERLDAVLRRLRGRFDCVIVHGQALLGAAVSVETARRSDAVLLCTLHRETRLPLLRRAVDRVAAMEIPLAGVVYLGATSNEALC